MNTKENANIGTASSDALADFETKAFLCGLKGKCSYGQIITYGGKQLRLPKSALDNEQQ